MSQAGVGSRWGLWVRELSSHAPALDPSGPDVLGARIEGLALMAEQQGAWAFWLSHRLSPLGLDGATLLAGLSVCTSRMLLGLMEDGEMLFGNPALSTKPISAVNLLSHGRALWGLWEIPDLCLPDGRVRAQILEIRRRLLRGEPVTADIPLGPGSSSHEEDARQTGEARNLHIQQAVCLPVLSDPGVGQYVSAGFLESALPWFGAEGDGEKAACLEQVVSSSSSSVIQGVLIEGPLDHSAFRKAALVSMAAQLGVELSEIDWVWVMPAPDDVQEALEEALARSDLLESSQHLGPVIARNIDQWTTRAVERGFGLVLIRL